MVCGEREWGPESKVHQCDECRIADLEAQLTWQPIETAPKDGTKIIGAEPVEGDWLYTRLHWQHDCWCEVVAVSSESVWHEPSHWLPDLPPVVPQ